MLFTFAELLRSYRERASLDQAALAAALRVHRNTVSTWERGQHRPRTRELVLQLAAELALAPDETDQLLRAADFPGQTQAPSAAPARHQLRPPVADFVGREQEAAQLVLALRAARTQASAVIVGVRGMGGAGKTELAYLVAHRARETFPDAQLMLQLRGMSAAPLTAAEALQAALRSLNPGARPPDDLPALEQLYRTALHGQRVLILADDARDAAQVRALIPPSGSALLITSRQRFTLPGMAAVDLEHLDADAAVALLRRICPRLGVAEAQAIARACDSLPLALRVSSGVLQNTPALPAADFGRRLADERRRLSQLRDPDDPQLDVAAVLALSYERLEPAPRQVFRQLGALAADFTTELAQEVAAAQADGALAELLGLLLRRNLVMYDAGRSRWRLHDLVRDLARCSLEAAGEREATLERYACAAVRIAAETQEQYLLGGPDVAAALARFDQERPHIDAARAWALSGAGAAAADALLVDDALATASIGRLRYALRSARLPQLEHACAAARRLGDRHSERRILQLLGHTYHDLGEFYREIPVCEEALAITRELGDRQGEASVLNSLGVACSNLGDIRRAIPLYEQALALARELGERRLEGGLLSNIGLAWMDLGESQRAAPCFEQALAIARALGNRHGEGLILNCLGLSKLSAGDVRHAVPYLEQALAVAREVGDRHSEANVLENLGRVDLGLGAAGQGIEHCEAALHLARETGNQRLQGAALNTLGRIYAALGAPDRAAAAFEQAHAALCATGDRWAEAECGWHFGGFLALAGEREQALPLLRASVAYKQEIGHAQADRHAALLARVAAGEPLSSQDWWDNGRVITLEVASARRYG